MVTLSTARFIIQNFYVLPTHCVYMLYVNMRTNSDYFPIHHKLIGFYNRDAKCLLRGTDWVFKYNSDYVFYVDLRKKNSDYFPIHHKLIGFYNRDAKCLLRGTDWVFKYNSGYVFYVDLRTYSDYFPIHHKLIGFYNRDEKCLQRGTDWAFKHS